MKFSKRTQRIDWEKNKHQPTRRDVLKQGLMSGVWFSVPTVLSQILWAKRAMADSGFGNLYVLQLDLQNGYASHGQFMAATAPGSSLNAAGFAQLGVNSSRPSASNGLYTAMGLPFWGTGNANAANTPANAAQFVSKIMSGIQERGGNAIAQTKAAAIMLRSSDDTNQNPMGLASALIQAGCKGTITGNFANSNTQSGLSQTEFIAGAKAGFARSVDDILNAAKINGLAHLPTGSINELVNGVESLSNRDLAKLNRLPQEVQVQALANKTFGKTKDFVTPPAGLDARQDTDAQAAFGITGTSAATDQNVVIASLMSGLMRDYFGVASVQLGGYDYHNTGLASTDQKDLDAGRVIGNMLNYANRKGKNLLVIVTSAGSVGGGSQTATDLNAARAWNGDRGTNSAVTLYYHQASGAINQLKSQVGYFLPDGGTSTDPNAAGDPVRGDVRRAMGAVIANALMLAKKENLISSVIPGMFSNSELDQLRIFG